MMETRRPSPVITSLEMIRCFLLNATKERDKDELNISFFVFFLTRSKSCGGRVHLFRKKLDEMKQDEMRKMR